MDFIEAERHFQWLEEQRTSGVLSADQYRAEVNRLQVTDAQGRLWMLQERTGRWFVHRDGAWVAAQPPQSGELAQSPKSVQNRQPSKPVQPSDSQSARPAQPKRKGCWGCLAVVAALTIIISGVSLWLANAPSDALTTGRRDKIATETIPASGGTLTVEGTDTELDGMTLSVPEGAYAKDQHITLSTRPIESHNLGSAFNPATPLIHLDNGGTFADIPMTLKIPVDIEPDSFAMAFYYDRRTGRLEGLPLKALTADHVTVVTSHFSDIVVSTIAWHLLEDVTVDTGFTPGYDDWQFTNYGSAIAPGGHCAGQSVTAMWYYYEKKLEDKERGLYGRYDNNDREYGTIDFQWDDSWGYRFASVVQEELIQWDHQSRAFFKALGKTSDHLTWNAFAYAMQITGEPQYAAIYSSSGGHAIIAHKIENGRIYVADPNYPGEDERALRYEQGAFLPYFSGANAAAISEEGETAYTAIRYMAKSAMVDWDGIAAEYERMREGQSGDGHFPDYTLDYLSGIDEESGEYIWTPVPETLTLSAADTATPGERFRGKLVLRVKLESPTPYQAGLYEGTELIEAYRNDEDHVVFLQTSLTVGNHDLGIEVDTVDDDTLYYVDFQRVRVIYGTEDLSGVWEGTWQIEEAQGVLQFVEDALTKIILWTGLVDSEAEAREAAAASIEVDPELFAVRPMRLDLEAIDPAKGDRYRMRIALDPSSPAYEGEAIYRDGVLTFKGQSEDASSSIFTGQQVTEGQLSGTFTTTAWGFIKDALIGSWQVSRIR